jgi:hypothetical protein
MEPSIRTIERAREVLAKVMAVAGPIQRGEAPFETSLHTIEEAHADAAAVLTFVADQLINNPSALDDGIVEIFGNGTSCFRTLTHVLLDSDTINESTKKVLRLSSFAPTYIAHQVTQAPADA